MYSLVEAGRTKKAVWALAGTGIMVLTAGYRCAIKLGKQGLLIAEFGIRFGSRRRHAKPDQ
jgi:hypothetical protein